MVTVLLVDDDPQMRATLGRVLTGEGYSVLEAQNGREAIGIVNSARPSVIITDILMPEKEGIETILEIRGIAPSAKIIAMSGGGHAGIADFLSIAKKLGAHHTLKKPFRVSALLEALKELTRVDPIRPAL